jgi:hypothetical protein
MNSSKFRFLAACGVASAITLAATSPDDNYGPHGGKLIGNAKRPVEIKLGPPKEDKSRDVDVYVLNQPKMNPQSGSVKIYPGPDDVNPIILEAVPLNDPGDTGPHYSGKLSPDTQRNVGIQIGLPIPGGREIISSREEIDSLGEGKTQVR